MKVFLMHKDKDFDLERELPSNAHELVQDLELKTLFDAMARDDEYLYKVAKQALLSGLHEPAEIVYRQEVLKDCQKNIALVRDTYRALIEFFEDKHRQWMFFFSRHPSSILSDALRMLEMSVKMLRKLREIADTRSGDFESPGFQSFFSMIRRELDEEYFELVEHHLAELRFRGGVLVSAELGNGNEGVNYVLRKNRPDGRGWLTRLFGDKEEVYTFTLHPRDENGALALGHLRDMGINQVANAVAQSADHIDSFLMALRTELAFYIGCVNLSQEFSRYGVPCSFPSPAPASGRLLSFSGLCDPCLALNMKQKLVGNDLDADGKNLCMITGANQGGKSTFLRGVGVAFLMMQAGIFVPAESFRGSVCTGLFTHFKREEDASMKSGKFDEELGRMSAIVDSITPDSVVLFNESFASTNEREGSEIAGQIVRGLLERRMRIFYVTHFYELAGGFYDLKMDDAVFLRADRLQDGTRTFKITRGEPLQTSFGRDLYDSIFKTDG